MTDQVPVLSAEIRALVQQLNERAQEAGLNTSDQHVVTQALLRRFTRSVPGCKWQLLWIDLTQQPPRQDFSTPKVCGVEKGPTKRDRTTVRL